MPQKSGHWTEQRVIVSPTCKRYLRIAGHVEYLRRLGNSIPAASPSYLSLLELQKLMICTLPNLSQIFLLYAVACKLQPT